MEKIVLSNASNFFLAFDNVLLIGTNDGQKENLFKPLHAVHPQETTVKMFCHLFCFHSDKRNHGNHGMSTWELLHSCCSKLGELQI